MTKAREPILTTTSTSFWNPDFERNRLFSGATTQNCSMCYLLRMRSGCCLFLVASLCAFITTPVPAQESTEQPSYKPPGLEFFSIENRKWRIAKYRADDGQQTDKDGLIDALRTPAITFRGGGVYGSGLCGGLTGFYKLSGRRMEVDAGFTLIGFCPPEEWSESLAVVKAFKGELSIEKVGDEILLRGKDRRARVRLVPFGLPPSDPTK
jgi:heat shock protein HslJ